VAKSTRSTQPGHPSMSNRNEYWQLVDIEEIASFV